MEPALEDNFPFKGTPCKVPRQLVGPQAKPGKMKVGKRYAKPKNGPGRLLEYQLASQVLIVTHSKPKYHFARRSPTP